MTDVGSSDCSLICKYVTEVVQLDGKACACCQTEYWQHEVAGESTSVILRIGFFSK